MKNSLKNKQRGFTLIELSIVIVIIGILVGGVVLGGKVIDRARLAKFATELADVNRAVILFQDTYNAMPGDYNGTGSENTTHTAGCGTTVATKNAAAVNYTAWPNICPGDGNGKINSATGAIYEYIFARNHLIYEGFLNDSFSRRLQNLGPQLNKFPKSYGDKILFYFINLSNDDSHGIGNSNDNLILIQDMRLRQTGGTYTDVGFLNGSLAYKIDKKIDDGYPKTGIIGNLGIRDGAAGAYCLLTSDNSKYDTAETTICNMVYKLE